MSTTKQEVVKLIEQMDDQAGVDDIMAQLYFYQKVNGGLRDLDEGRVVSHEKVKERMLSSSFSHF